MIALVFLCFIMAENVTLAYQIAQGSNSPEKLSQLRFPYSVVYPFTERVS